jgi:lysophospholipase
MLIVAPGRDRIVSTAASRLFADHSGAASHLVIADAKHELLMEQNDHRGRFWSAFDSFAA